MKPVEVSDTAKERIKGMVSIRNCTQELIDMQLEEYSDAAIRKSRKNLIACMIISLRNMV